MHLKEMRTLRVFYTTITYLYVNKFVVYGYSKRYGKFTREPSFKNFLLVVSMAKGVTIGQRPAS